MDILAHALWTHAVHRGTAIKKNLKPSKKAIWAVIFFGTVPDLFSFGLFFLAQVYKVFLEGEAFFISKHLDPSVIPKYVYDSYNYTHSLVIFSVAFLLIWLIHKKPFWFMFGWGFHILIDIFSHAKSFFPTPFLFPISNFRVDGWSWGHSTFMIINYSLLTLAYLLLYFFSRKKEKAPA